MLPGLLVANDQAQQAGLVSPEELPLVARAIGHLRRWAIAFAVTETVARRPSPRAQWGWQAPQVT
ncbi:hypothetical protein WAE31_08905 (plasmid) [Xanthomonas axonopodis pv. vasculorum]